MKILYIGNSYIFYNDLPGILQQLCRDNGKDVTIHSVTKGGRRLYRYEDDTDPVTQSLNEALKEDYDVCIIQEQSLLPVVDPEKFMHGLSVVTGKVRDHVKKLMLYVTWGRKVGSPDLETLNMTTESMAYALQDSYQKAADTYGMTPSPVGMNFLKVYSEHPEIDLYAPDFSHPSYNGTCLVALTHYKTIFGEIPENTRALEISEEFMEILKGSLQ